MTETFSPQDEPELSGSILDFTPVPLKRRRYDGWSPEMQKRFIRALSVMGSVGAACHALGKGRVSAYRLREREGAESFAAAWDAAIEEGKLRQFDYFLERAMNGVTTVHIQRGGAVSVTGGPDMSLLRAAMAK